MHTIHLNGANPEEIAKTLGGVLVLHDITNDEAKIANVDPDKLQKFEEMLGSPTLPQYNAEEDGDYGDWLISNNMD